MSLLLSKEHPGAAVCHKNQDADSGATPSFDHREFSPVSDRFS